MTTTDLLLIPLTLALVSAARKLSPRIDGKPLVFACATLVGVGLSFAEQYLLGAEQLAPWLVAVRGAAAAAVAFGFASWPRWAASVLRDAASSVTLISHDDGEPDA